MAIPSTYGFVHKLSGSETFFFFGLNIYGGFSQNLESELAVLMFSCEHLFFYT